MTRNETDLDRWAAARIDDPICDDQAERHGWRGDPAHTVIAFALALPLALAAAWHGVSVALADKPAPVAQLTEDNT
jgi:hypothetical protein